MKSRKWAIIATTACLLLGTSVIALASNPIKLMINGHEHKTDTPPQIINGQVMLPLNIVTELFNKKISYDANINVVNIQDKKDIVISELGNIKITGMEDDYGVYEHLRIYQDQTNRSLAGYNVMNPTYAPEISSVDLNGDEKREIAIILTTGYGTGVYLSEIRILSDDLGRNMPVEDALFTFKKQWTGKVSNKGIEMRINDKQILLPNELLNEERENWFEEPMIGNIVHYYIENKTLKASAAVQISPGEFIGELETHYEYINGIFVAGEATFSKFDE
ncbi:stalk domain-containing protein [Paenibacillus crassostreae]|uniref:Copper amine oxidase-like N-terminal domain-containing protein n=1 Tax=Paenibacillus crassostreae TaxID=1763538 RepID=A0A167DI18_9BACL|nr:stalk domain-containing protein [Paenibacillus crassostreae]AOZ91443.1 hypothetical protein LPB68_03960 [Paenibacillus crassostreae]OAB74398.1 hypothetical protein PNBC_10000 [Paenibacillus crassostreae]